VPRRIESHFIEGPAGRLEARLEEPEQAPPRGIAVICHPHPLYGGTMHNKVVHHVARGLRRAGHVALRFNFRGVGRSQGEYAHLEGEIEDARAAARWLQSRYPELPLTLAGFSFGARVVTRLGCDAGAARLIAAGFPVRMAGTTYLESCAVPKVFIQSTADEFGPKPAMDELYSRASEPKQMIWIQAADHFFAGALDELESRVYTLGQATQ
jgi:uncharacterized protein